MLCLIHVILGGQFKSKPSSGGDGGRRAGCGVRLKIDRGEGQGRAEPAAAAAREGQPGAPPDPSRPHLDQGGGALHPQGNAAVPLRCPAMQNMVRLTKARGALVGWRVIPFTS